jgi:hypothetical protein
VEIGEESRIWSLRLESGRIVRIDLGPPWNGSIAVSAIDRLGNESRRAAMEVIRPAAKPPDQ